ncbi:MAG: hypothetical protein ACYTHK_09620, partial [Planctomycetota bacterium]
MRRFLFLGLFCVLAAVAGATVIDFDDLIEGEIVDDINGVKVFGFNPSFGTNVNAAVVFDSEDPTGGD